MQLRLPRRPRQDSARGGARALLGVWWRDRDRRARSHRRRLHRVRARTAASADARAPAPIDRRAALAAPARLDADAAAADARELRRAGWSNGRARSARGAERAAYLSGDEHAVASVGTHAPGRARAGRSSRARDAAAR